MGNATAPEPTPEAISHMKAHILAQLSAHRTRHASAPAPAPAPPLLAGVQGPQGSGKTFLTNLLRDALQAAPHHLHVAVLSLDDLYLPHADLAALARAHPHNALWAGRGLPGTHDAALGTAVLARLRRINDPDAEPHPAGGVELPRFDKSLFGGEGDRAPQGSTVVVRPPVDVVLFEGWCVGFCPVSEAEVRARWARPVPGLGNAFFATRGFRVEDVLAVNERLRAYVGWWESLDTFIQIKPPDEHPYTYIYKWRLQQEHHMKAQNGGRGMTDEQVEAFVDRYIPGYVFFGDGVTEGYEEAPGRRTRPPWVGRGLQIQIGECREVLNVCEF